MNRDIDTIGAALLDSAPWRPSMLERWRAMRARAEAMEPEELAGRFGAVATELLGEGRLELALEAIALFGTAMDEEEREHRRGDDLLYAAMEALTPLVVRLHEALGAGVALVEQRQPSGLLGQSWVRDATAAMAESDRVCREVNETFARTPPEVSGGG
jgi:hypothetical protein